MSLLARSIATWFGCGYFPWGPGTAGSLAAVLLGLGLVWATGASGWLIGLLGLVAAVPGMWAAGRLSRDIGRKDPSIVVVDEVVGQWLTYAGAMSLTPAAWLLGFCLFRLFDIVKPFPVRSLERLPGGIGIVSDDLMAGVYAALTLWLLGWLQLY